MTSFKDRGGEFEGIEPFDTSSRALASPEDADALFPDRAPDGIDAAGPLSVKGLVVDNPVARQARMVFGLLQAAVEEVAETAESRNVKLAAELRDLQMRALRSIQESALATIELFEVLGGARTPGELASRQIELARRQSETASTRLAEFLQVARKIAAVMTFAPNRGLREPQAAPASGPEQGAHTLLSRLEKLTARQKCVLQLVAEGLPNKVIAHRLGISETTVKAHVGEILRKLKVYSRARAIVMLTQLDITRIGDLSACCEAEE
jgi:ATP/maltotriose-dependent transcriptional regulator MalT